MLIVAALLLFAVGLMHSVLGGRRLINPILRRADLPVILGSLANTRVTLLVGWHLLTLFWWLLAAVLVALALTPQWAAQVLLFGLAFSTGLTGVLALILSKGRHRSWVFFLPISVIAALAGFGF
jgi:hypothetical protein